MGVNAPDTEREAVGTTKAWEHDWKHPTATAAVAAMEGRFRLPFTLDFWKQTGAMVFVSVCWVLYSVCFRMKARTREHAGTYRKISHPLYLLKLGENGPPRPLQLAVGEVR